VVVTLDGAQHQLRPAIPDVQGAALLVLINTGGHDGPSAGHGEPLT